jgi:hypothetical protein
MKLKKYKYNRQTENCLLFIAMSFVCIFTISFTSCKKDDKDDPIVPITEKGTVLLHLHNYLDDTDLGEVPGIFNTNNAGRDISITKADLYISEIQFIKLDGTIHSFSEKRILKTFSNVLYLLGEIPVGNYNTVKFKVGLDSTTNATNPSSSPDSVILNKPDMWFGSTVQPDGYVFMNVQGMIDTSSDLSGAHIPYNYKIGTNENYQSITVTGINLTIIKDQAQTAHMVADYNILFNGIQLNQSSNLSITTPAENNSALADIVATNIQNMFKPE